MELDICLTFEVHAKKTKRGYRYRVKHTNYPGYITKEMSQAQVKEWLRQKYNEQIERKLSVLFHPTQSNLKLFGNSHYGIGRARDLDREWDE